MPTTETENEYKYAQSIPQVNYADLLEKVKTNGGPVLDLFLKNNPAPRPELDEQQQKKAKFGAAISDTVSTLAEMFAHGQGASVRNREGKNSTQTTNERLKAIQDKYDNDTLRFNAAKGNAQLQDFNMLLQKAMSERGEQREYYLRKAERLAADEKMEKQRKWQLDDREAEKKWRKEMSDDEFQKRLKLTYAGKSTGGYKNDKTLPVYNIPVPAGTQGAQVNPFTGKSYIQSPIGGNDKLSIITNLPGGKQAYILKNKLYKSHTYNDEFGVQRNTTVPFSDDEVIQYFLENEYYQNNYGQQPQVQQPQVQQQQPWNIWQPVQQQQQQPVQQQQPMAPAPRPAPKQQAPKQQAQQQSKYIF